jgi:hypothetical protein
MLYDNVSSVYSGIRGCAGHPSNPIPCLSTGPQVWEHSYGSEPTPLRIHVEPKFMAKKKSKVSSARLFNNLNQPYFADGPP